MMRTITNTPGNREEVWTAFRRTHEVRLRERSHRLLLLKAGKTCPDIAPWVSREAETMRHWGQAWNTDGLPGLERAPIPGRPT